MIPAQTFLFQRIWKLLTRRFIAKYHTRKKSRIPIYLSQEIFAETLSSRIVFWSQVLHASVMKCVQLFFCKNPLHGGIRQVMISSNDSDTGFRFLFDSTNNRFHIS
ncbi:hypothetical protein RF55_24328 [Lasius niger]|uniref:Uncharacterized protein n=1 Tax=Lasius niger TaxID=67767 RepID=A0A0J7JW48_LASNI|nr:hypothetical protein RF55_24328 [Lasius niger]